MSTDVKPAGSEKVIKMSKGGGPNSRARVTRGEVIDIMTQLTENVNQMGNYLMQDVNTMYAHHVFPTQMRLAILEDIMIEKGFTTSDDITRLVNERIEALKKQAQELKEQQDRESESSDDTVPTNSEAE